MKFSTHYTKHSSQKCAMGFHRMLVQLTWAGVILSDMAAAATAFPSTLLDCPDKCGDLQIPYPFSLTEGCYLKGSTSFYVNYTLNSNREPLPLTGNVIVTNISKARLTSWCITPLTVATSWARVWVTSGSGSEGSITQFSQFLILKTRSWPLAVTLTHTLMGF